MDFFGIDNYYTHWLIIQPSKGEIPMKIQKEIPTFMDPLYKNQGSLFLASVHSNIEQNRNNTKDRNENTLGKVKIAYVSYKIWVKLQGLDQILN